MKSILIQAILAFVILPSTFAIPHADDVKDISTKILNGHFKPAVPFHIDEATQLSTVDKKSQWRLVGNKGTFEVDIEEEDKETLSLLTVHQIDEDGAKTLIFQPSGLPTTWILGCGIALVLVGIVVLSSSRPSSIARAPIAPPTSPKSNNDSAKGSIRRRRSKLE